MLVQASFALSRWWSHVGVAVRFAIPAVITELLFSINWVSRVHRDYVDSYG